MIKSKKTARKSLWIALLSILAVGVVAFSATYAYFTAQTKQISTGDITIGTVKLALNGKTSLESTSHLLPGTTILSSTGGNPSLTITNQSNVDTYIVLRLDAAILESKDGKEVDFSAFKDVTSRESVKGTVNELVISDIVLGLEVSDDNSDKYVWEPVDGYEGYYLLKIKGAEAAADTYTVKPDADANVFSVFDGTLEFNAGYKEVTTQTGDGATDYQTVYSVTPAGGTEKTGIGSVQDKYLSLRIQAFQLQADIFTAGELTETITSQKIMAKFDTEFKFTTPTT